jgi:hypothetical protein
VVDLGNIGLCSEINVRLEIVKTACVTAEVLWGLW